MDLKHVIFLVFLIVPAVSDSIFDDWFDFDFDSSEEVNDFYPVIDDDLWPTMRYSTGVCYFRLDQTYHPREFVATIKLDSMTLDMTAKNYQTFNRDALGMEYKLTNLRTQYKGFRCVRFKISHFGWRVPNYWCYMSTGPTNLPPTTPSLTSTSTSPPLTSTSTSPPLTSTPTSPPLTSTSTSPPVTSTSTKSTSKSSTPVPTTTSTTQPSTTTEPTTQPSSSTSTTTTTSATTTINTTPSYSSSTVTTVVTPTIPPTTLPTTTIEPIKTTSTRTTTPVSSTSTTHKPSPTTTMSITSTTQKTSPTTLRTSTTTSTKVTLPTRPPPPEPA
ncbi:uncharacterized protein LOC134714686 isoform X2 [Mytilus trossulus]